MPATTPAVRTMSITWHGPFAVAGTTNPVWVAPVSAGCGLYLCAIPTPGGLLAHRIGASERPFWRRLHDELEAYGRGEYPIHRASSLARGRRDPLHRGFFGSAECRARQQQHFRNRLPKLKGDMQRTQALLALYLAPLDTDPRICQRIQAAIANRVRSAGNRAAALLETRGPPGDRLRVEIPIQVVSCGCERVVGMPGVFEA